MRSPNACSSRFASHFLANLSDMIIIPLLMGSVACKRVIHC
jgi:hypothetical protein